MMLPRVRGLVSLLVVVLAVFFAGVHWFVLPPDGWVTGDQGSKYLQTKAFAEHGPLAPGIDVLSRDLDPEYRFQEPKMKNRRGRLVSEFLWLLPLITAPFYWLLGMRGLYVVPAVSVIVTALIAAALARRLTADRHAWLAWIAVVATPVIVYGLEFWEHAPAVACVMAAALLALPSPDRRRDSIRLLGAGALVATGVQFREEVAVALPALVAARAFSVSDRRFATLILGGLWTGAGAILVFLAAVPVNLMIYGAPLPMHMTQDAWEVAKAVPYTQVRRDILIGLFLPAEHVALFLAAAAAGLASALVQRRRMARHGAADDRTSGMLLAVVHFAVIVMLTIAVVLPIYAMATEGVRRDAYRITSAAHTWTVVFALLYWPWFRSGVNREVGRFLTASGLLMVAGAFVISPTDGGSQWSPRFFLAAVPFPALVAGAATFPPGDWRGLNLRAALRPAIAAFVVLASMLMQATGAGWVKHGKQHTSRVLGWVANRTAPGDVLISNVFWFPEVTATLAPTRRFLFSWSGEQVPAMAALAVAHGLQRFRLVTSPALTGYEAPPFLDVPGAECRFMRGEPTALADLLVNEYSCAPR